MLWTKEYDKLKCVDSRSKGTEEKKNKTQIFLLLKKIKRVMKARAKKFSWEIIFTRGTSRNNP